MVSDNIQTEPGGLADNRKPFASANRKSIILFCAATFFYWIALYLYVPILPVYAQSLGASLSLVGVVIASYALPQMFLRIPIGIWFDALNKRKPLVAAGIVIALVGALGLGLAPDTSFLILARATTGIGAAAWVTFTIYFASYFTQEKIGQAIGIINFVTSASLVVATAGGGAIAETLSLKHTFFAATLLGAISLIALLATQEPKAPRIETASRFKFTQMLTHPLILTVAFIGLLLHFVDFAGVFGFIPVYGAKIGASSVELGIITMLTLGASAVTALLTANMVEKWGNSTTIILGSVLMGAALLAVPFTHKVGMLAAVQVVNGLGRGMLSTVLMTLSIRAVAPQRQATAMGIYQAIYAVGMLLGPLVSGFLAESLGLANVFYLCALLSLVVAGISRLPILPRH